MIVRLADTVAGGLRVLGAETLDVILSDLGLPDSSGHDLLRQTRAAGIDTPAIVLSGFGSDKDRAQSAAAGFTAHLTKPIDFDLLIDTVRHVSTRTPQGPAPTAIR
jgi:DNA-binding response OmpR family regulator